MPIGLAYPMRMALALLTSLFLLAVWAGSAGAQPSVQGRAGVLVLHSYSPDFVWTRLQQEGIDAVFRPLEAEYDLRIEYLDAVHHPELLQKPLALDLLRAKLAAQRPRLVLTSDNAAFDFARTHRSELFPGAPIVFMGLNGYEDGKLRGETGITGIAEDPDLAGTLKAILQLRPGTQRIVFPGMADDLTYRAIRSTVAADLTVLPPKIAVEFPEFPDVDAALEALRSLPADAAIVVMTNMRTRGGEGITSQRVVELVSAAATVPVFTNWDFVVGHGAVGGSVISGIEQGRLAAEVALRILRGEHPEAIPVHRGAGRALIFDDRQLVRFGIPSSRLPGGAQVLFAPEHVMRVPREVAWTSALLFLLLIAVTASLAISVRRQRRAEAQVRAFNRDLEERVSRRTMELEAANRELEQFSYSLSHDMRTPLRALDGFSTILLEKHAINLDEEGRRLLKVLQDNARYQGRLIDDILLFLALGRQKVNHRVVDVAQMAASIFAELREAAPGRAMSLEIDSLPAAWGDPVMIRLVVKNLLSNAVKHTPPERDVMVHIGGRSTADENIYSISDRGIGFDMRYADKLFKVFQRVHPRGEYEGSAVGLAIVKRVADRHGGRVWAESAENSGATFHFALPKRSD